MPKFAANLTMLFGEMPFLDRFAAAKAAGFSGVEYLFPYEFEKAALREQLQQHGLTQVLHNLPAGNWTAGEQSAVCCRCPRAATHSSIDRADQHSRHSRFLPEWDKASGSGHLRCPIGKSLYPV
jgi:hydroxypyruvate isomerase